MKAKLLLVFFILFTGVLDLLTFYFGNLHALEINPIYVLTGSFSVVVIFKFITLFLLCFYLITYKPKRTYMFAYLIVFMSIFIILAQCLGVYTNLETAEQYKEDPVNTQPMPADQAIQTYAFFSILLYFLPLLFCLLVFFTFEKIYLKEYLEARK